VELLTNSVVINEFMPAPLEDEPEWIELYNPNNSTLSLLYFSISDESNCKILPEILNIETKLTLTPKPFSPINLTVKDKCVIPFILPFTEQQTMFLQKKQLL